MITPYATHLVARDTTTVTYRVDLTSPQMFVLGGDVAYTDQLFVEMDVDRHPSNDARLNLATAARVAVAEDAPRVDVPGWETRALHASRNAHDFAIAAAIGA